jgi:hypothetical protein
LYEFLIHPIHAAYPSHLIILHLFSLITYSEECKLRSSSLCSFCESRVTSGLIRPNILLSRVFSLILKVRDQVWHPYKFTGKIIVNVFWSLNKFPLCSLNMFYYRSLPSTLTH